MLEQALAYKEQGLLSHNGQKGPTIDQKFINYCQDNGISLPRNTSFRPGREELDRSWDVTIAQLQVHREALAAELQSYIGTLHDNVGQYDSYLQSTKASLAQS